MHQRLIDWIESNLRVTQGNRQGQPFKLLPWEKRVLREIYRTGRVETGVSVARSNGKTTLVSAIAAAAVCPGGPLAVPRSESLVVASALNQSRVAFAHIKAFVESAGHDISKRKVWLVNDSTNSVRIQYKPTGTGVSCLSSDPRRMHGHGASSLVICDEPAQWSTHHRDRMIAALRTGLGKQSGSKLICIGTAASETGHWYNELLQTDDRRRKGINYTVPMDVDEAELLNEEYYKMANPSFAAFPALRDAIRADAALAAKDPKALQAFRAYRLNQPIYDTIRLHLLDVQDWIACAANPPPRAGECFWAVDLGANRSGSAIVACWPQNGRMECLLCFPEKPSLSEREARCGAPEGLFTRAHKAGEIVLAGSRSPDIEYLVGQAADRFGQPSVVAADRWADAGLEQAFEYHGLRYDPRFRGMGWKDGSQDISAARYLAGDRLMRPVSTPLWAWSLGRTVVDTNQLQGSRFVKSEGDDIAIATALACGVLRREGPVLAESSGPQWFDI